MRTKDNIKMLLSRDKKISILGIKLLNNSDLSANEANLIVSVCFWKNIDINLFYKVFLKATNLHAITSHNKEIFINNLKSFTGYNDDEIINLIWELLNEH